VYPLIDTEASTDPVPVYRGSKPPVPSKPPPAAPGGADGRGKRLALFGVAILAIGVVGWQFVRSSAPADPALLALDHLADSVTDAVRGYGSSEQKFAAHRIDCPRLAEDFGQVDALWVSYNLGKRRAGPLDATRQSRDRTLDASVDSVGRDFDRSGCPRP
jgi:hypothetical protein